jgi:hypothetical protein
MKESLFLFITFLITANAFHSIKTQVTTVKNHHQSFAVIDPSTGQVPPLGFFDPLVLTLYLLSKLHYKASVRTGYNTMYKTIENLLSFCNKVLTASMLLLRNISPTI